MSRLEVTATKLAQLIDPQVLAPLINKKLIDLLKFAPLARVDFTLQGRPGSTVTLPNYTYIGDATDVAEGDDIPIAQLTQEFVEVTIKKAGRGVQITDEAILSGYGDPVGEAITQLAMSIASKLDKDVIASLVGIEAPMVFEVGDSIDEDAVANALVKFGEDLDGDKVLLIHPKQLAGLRTSSEWIKATDMGVERLMSGVQGMIWGCQVVVSERVPYDSADLVYTNFIVKPGALAIYMKRDTELETDRDIVNKSNVMTGDKHYVTYLYDVSKAIKILTDEVKGIITIGTQPANATAVEGDIDETLTVVATKTGDAPLKYQWYTASSAQHADPEAIEGETANTYEVPEDLDAGAHYYFVVVDADDAKAVTSDVATVTITED